MYIYIYITLQNQADKNHTGSKILLYKRVIEYVLKLIYGFSAVYLFFFSPFAIKKIIVGIQLIV